MSAYLLANAPRDGYRLACLGQGDAGPEPGYRITVACSVSRSCTLLSSLGRNLAGSKLRRSRMSCVFGKGVPRNTSTRLDILLDILLSVKAHRIGGAVHAQRGRVGAVSKSFSALVTHSRMTVRTVFGTVIHELSFSRCGPFNRADNFLSPGEIRWRGDDHIQRKRNIVKHRRISNRCSRMEPSAAITNNKSTSLSGRASPRACEPKRMIFSG